MKIPLFRLTLKHATLIAAIGTTVYTFFVPICRMLFGHNAVWFNYAEHPWLYNAWYLFFSCTLMVSWAVLALGMIRDEEHIPILGKGFRYALLVFVVVLGIYILLDNSIIVSQGRLWLYTDRWLQLLFLLVCDVVLWYIYAHIHTAGHPHLPHWQKGLCWAVVVLTLLVVAVQLVAVLWYAYSVMQSGSTLFPREVYYNTNCIRNWMIFCIPVVFYLFIFFQPSLNRKARRKMQG